MPAAAVTAGDPPEMQGIALSAKTPLEVRARDGAHVYHVNANGDYYAETPWLVKLEDEELRAQDNLVLEIEYLDEGLGVIRATRLLDPAFNGSYGEPGEGASYTRLNSGTVRRAAFRFEEATSDTEVDGKADFIVTGVQHVRAIRVLREVPEGYWTALRDAIPRDVAAPPPHKRPLQIVMSADGALSGTVRHPLDEMSTRLRESLPLVKALGFNAIESYVRWNFVEPELGRFDWTIYDTIVEELERHGLQWFPLLIVGSGYALPEWFFKSEENIGFECLEHGRTNPIQSIWSPHHQKHVTRFLQAFGEHYEPRGVLQGVRLGPSGNFGESQYPAGGNWGFRGEQMHIHIGMWAGDPYAREALRRAMHEKYGTIAALNKAWSTDHASFDSVEPLLPEHCHSKRQRVDLNQWYTDAMSEWCEWWAVEARKAMPETVIYQSAGGWGATEIGTDYSAQTKSMLEIDGGIRLTNELDSFHQCFYATRLCATAARCYDVPLGFEPAMGHTARGVAGRLFNFIANGGEHFFTYWHNVAGQQKAIDTWQRHYALIDARTKPHVEVAVYYPQTMNYLSSDTFRYLNAWGFNPYARKIRDVLEVDYVDDRLIQEGYLDRYKVLVFAWGEYSEAETIDAADAWLRAGGTVLFPYFLNTELSTVEDDRTVFRRWRMGDTGEGEFHHYRGDDEPPALYAEFVRAKLLEHDGLSPWTRVALEVERPETVFLSVLDDGHLLALNFHEEPATITHTHFGSRELDPFSIERIPLD
jgi:glycosyl hydrolase family 14